MFIAAGVVAFLSIFVLFAITRNACWWYKQCDTWDITTNTRIQIYNTPVYDWLGFIIPFVLIFYTIGWVNHRKKINKLEHTEQQVALEQKEMQSEKQAKFKMTFKNSWWQCLLALLISWLVIRTAIIFILVFSHVRLGNEDISRVGVVVAFIFAVWFARYLSRKTWEKKQI